MGTQPHPGVDEGSVAPVLEQTFNFYLNQKDNKPMNTLPQGYTVTHPTLDDVNAVFDIIKASDTALYGALEPGHTLDDLRHEWQAPDHNLATDTWIVLSPAGRLVGSSGVWHRKDYLRFYTHPNVHPEYSDVGISSFLLQKAEECARHYIPHASPEARITLSTGLPAIDKAGQQRLAKEGFTRIRRAWRMEIALNEAPPKPQWPEGIVVRTFISGQEERAVFDAVEEAFRDHWGYMPGNFAQWQHWTVERQVFDPSLWFLACAGNEIAGTSLCEYQAVDRGWVNDLAVRRPWRRKGLGMALLYHSFGEFYRRGIRNVGLEVDSQNLTGATRLYERVGMHATRQYDTFEKELRPGVELSTQSLPV